MLRKTVNIILTGLFLFSTMGFTVSRHYCGTHLVDFSVDSKAKSCCDMDGCCHTDHQHFQVKDDFVGTISTADFQQFTIDVLFPVLFLQNNIAPKETVNNESLLADLPPPKIQTTLSLLQTYLC